MFYLSGIYVSLGHGPLRLGWLVLLWFYTISHCFFTIAERIPDIILEIIGLLLVTDVFVEFDAG